MTDPRPVVWPLPLAAREGIATARNGRWTSLLIVIAVAACIAGPAAADASAVSRLIADEQAWINAGGHVFVVTGARTEATENPIVSTTCDRLAQLDGVSAAFALRPVENRAAFSHIPGGRAPVYEVTPGAPAFLGSVAGLGAPVIVTTGLAQRTGVRDGETVRLIESDGLVTSPPSDQLVAQVADSAVMGEEYDGAFLVPTVWVGDARVCFVRTDSAHYSAVAAVLPTLLAYDGQPALVQPRLFSSEFTVDYAHAYEDRALRWLWVPSAVLLLLIWAITQWFRRSQLAIYTTFGMRTASRMTMQASEWAVLSAFGLMWGWGIGVTWALALGSRVDVAAALVSSHAAATLLTASAAVVLFGMRPTGSLLDALKDRS